MKHLKANIGDKTPHWKKDLAVNFFSRVGYIVSFEEKRHLINGIEILPDDKEDVLMFNYINLFNYVHSLEEISQKRLHKIRLKKTI
jgi:hypothetical protein